MFEQLKEFLAPPEFATEEKTSVARVLNTILLALIASTLIVCAVLAFIEAYRGLSALVAGIVFSALLLGARFLMRRRSLELASWLAATSFFAEAVLATYALGGLEGSGTVTLAFAIIVASVLLRERRAVALFTGGALATVFMLYAAEVSGLAGHAVAPTGLSDLLIDATAFALTGVLLDHTVRRLNTALRETDAAERVVMESRQQLEALNVMLEARVAGRTRALQLSAEVSRRLSTILDKEQLVREVVDQLQRAFDYYHVHIYLLDGRGERLLMAGGTGEAGWQMLQEGHSLAVGKGLVGRAADTSLPVLVPDVREEPAWLPNPHLPETKCEAAVPIIVGDRVIGVLDVQENTVAALTPEDVELLEIISGQVAVALRNADLYRGAWKSRCSSTALRSAFSIRPMLTMLSRLPYGSWGAR
jgi:putative methionine-R-sulfoxide reductase with GAF domain